MSLGRSFSKTLLITGNFAESALAAFVHAPVTLENLRVRRARAGKLLTTGAIPSLPSSYAPAQWISMFAFTARERYHVCSPRAHYQVARLL